MIQTFIFPCLETNNYTGLLGERLGLQPHSHCHKDIYPCTVSPYLPCTKLPHSVLRCLGGRSSLWRLGDILKRVHLQSYPVFVGQVRSGWTLYESARYMGHKCWCQHRARCGDLPHAVVHCADPSDIQIAKGRLGRNVCARC